MTTNDAVMIRGRSPWYRRLPARAAVTLALLAPFAPQSLAFAADLRERPMSAPEASASRAGVVSSRWIELALSEDEYAAAYVGDPGRYVISSADDPDYKGGVSPVAVHHRHFPESAPYAPGSGDPCKIEVVYRIYLELPEASPLKEGMSYSVSADASVGISGPFPFLFDKIAPNEAIHVNQVAYLADGPKIAYLSAWTGQGSVDFSSAPVFQLIDEASGEVAFEGAVELSIPAEKEKWSRSNVYSLDFSAFKGEGRYRIHVPTVGSSFPFRITAWAYNQIGYTVIRGLTMQRDGDHGLDSPSITHWHRPPAHLDDAIVESTGKKVDLVGGHMDAGDRGKYFHNVADVSAAMLSAMALFPEEVEALGESLELPESSNGAPDFLDEAVYELDFLRKAVMNTPKDGTLPFYLRPQNGDGSGGYEMGAPPEGKKDRKLYDVTMGPNRAETLYGAGALAMAANNPLMKKYFPERCEAYLEAAKRAFSGFEKHHAEAGYFKDAGWYDTWKEGPEPWSDEMLVAAANLYEVTGDEKYRTALSAALPTDLKATKLWGWQLGGPWLPAFISMYSSAKLEAKMPGIKQKALDAIVNWGDATLQKDGKAFDAPFGAPIPSTVYSQVGWYFSGEQVGFPLMVAYGVTKDAKYRDTLVKTWSWLLGANPLSRSFYSGLGDPSRSPRWSVNEIAHYNWIEGVWTELPPGLPSADIQSGSFDGYLDDDHNKARKDKKFPAADQFAALYRFHDSWTVKNEYTINRMARGAASLIPLVSRSPMTEAPNGSAPGSGSAPAGSNPGAPGASADGSGSEVLIAGCSVGSGRALHGPGALLALAVMGLALRLRRRAR